MFTFKRKFCNVGLGFKELSPTCTPPTYPFNNHIWCIIAAGGLEKMVALLVKDTPKFVAIAAAC